MIFIIFQVLAESTALAFVTSLSLAPVDDVDGRSSASDALVSVNSTGVSLEQKWLGQDYYNPFHRTGLALDQPYEGVHY